MYSNPPCINYCIINMFVYRCIMIDVNILYDNVIHVEWETFLLMKYEHWLIVLQYASCDWYECQLYEVCDDCMYLDNCEQCHNQLLIDVVTDIWWDLGLTTICILMRMNALLCMMRWKSHIIESITLDFHCKDGGNVRYIPYLLSSYIPWLLSNSGCRLNSGSFWGHGWCDRLGLVRIVYQRYSRAQGAAQEVDSFDPSDVGKASRTCVVCIACSAIDVRRIVLPLCDVAVFVILSAGRLT